MFQSPAARYIAPNAPASPQTFVRTGVEFAAPLSSPDAPGAEPDCLLSILYCNELAITAGKIQPGEGYVFFNETQKNTGGAAADLKFTDLLIPSGYRLLLQGGSFDTDDQSGGLGVVCGFCKQSTAPTLSNKNTASPPFPMNFGQGFMPLQVVTGVPSAFSGNPNKFPIPGGYKISSLAQQVAASKSVYIVLFGVMVRDISMLSQRSDY